jgi:2'-5' RNA ligase
MVDEKALIDKRVLNNTVVDTPSVVEGEHPVLHHILQLALSADGFTPWGENPAKRDQELRDFWPTESWLASATYGVTIRNASFAWEVVGADPEKPNPRNTIRAVTNMLHMSNRGLGWQDLIIKTCTDIYTQDNGGFWELIRAKDNPESAVLNIAHLDASRCLRTGDPLYPVLYTNRQGVEIPMKWYQVMPLEEFPSPIERMYGIQYCAVTRALMSAQILRDVAIYKHEKISGQFTRAIDIVSNVQRSAVDDAISLSQEQRLNRGLYRYTQPVLVTGTDPTSPVTHVHIDLASLPDGFDEEVTLKWYIAQLALAYGVDYQEFAPLMTGNLGAGSQSEMLHMKTRGKGPALIMGVLEHKLNTYGIIPKNIKFRFKEQDLRSESERAEARFTRAKARSMQLGSGELDAEAARQLAVEDGDIPEWMAREVDSRAKKRQREMEQQQATMPKEPVTDDTPAGENTDEFGSDQIVGGIDSHATRKEVETPYLTMDDVDRVRQALSIVQDKASYGSPDATIVMGLDRVEQILQFQSGLAQVYASQPIRWVPEYQFHISLVSSPLMDDLEFDAAYYELKSKQSAFSLPLNIEAGRVGIFDKGSYQALVLLVTHTYDLDVLQATVYDILRKQGVPLSEYSEPEKWQPHITLGYLPAGLEVATGAIAPVHVAGDEVIFSRGDFMNMYSLRTEDAV